MTSENEKNSTDVCSWCKEPYDTIEIGVSMGEAVQQGICEKCIDNFLSPRGVTLRQYLDRLPVPVLVVDRDMVVQMANAAARRKLGKNDKEMEQYRGGDVFACAHARLPGGCGRTIHCSGCAIRQSVMKTWETGEALHAVPATLTPAEPGTPAEIALTVTTYKANDLVMLRVDWVERS